MLLVARSLQLNGEKAVKANEDLGWRCRSCMAVISGQNALDWDCPDCGPDENATDKGFHVSSIPKGCLAIDDGERLVMEDWFVEYPEMGWDPITCSDCLGPIGFYMEEEREYGDNSEMVGYFWCPDCDTLSPSDDGRFMLTSFQLEPIAPRGTLWCTDGEVV